jgi:hypothetical protein
VLFDSFINIAQHISLGDDGASRGEFAMEILGDKDSVIFSEGSKAREEGRETIRRCNHLFRTGADKVKEV